MLLQVDADAAKQHGRTADVGLVGAQRCVQREQRHVVAASDELGGERVVAKAAAAVHAAGTRCDGEDLHAPENAAREAKGASSPLQKRGLKRARAEQKLDDVAFVRLEPVELDGRNRTEIQSIDVNRVDQRATELGPAR